MLNGNFQFFHQFSNNVRPALALVVLGLPADVFWPGLTCVILFAVGLIKIFKDELPQEHGLDKVLPFGRLFYAIPMAVFGTEHFVDTKFIVRLVPKWLPWHLFWTYFVGAALIAAALSIILKIQARLAATLLGCMFLVFVATIHVHNIMATHGARLFWAIGLREVAFSGGAFAVAANQWKKTSSDGAPWLVTIARIFVGIPAIVFGVEHFLHPTLAPGVPLDILTPAWIPVHLFWTYLMGAALLICGAGIVLNQKARSAATYLGIMILLIVAVIYVPMTIANPSDLDSGLNSFVDTLAFSGTALVLANAIRERESGEGNLA